ncbi:aldehyde dehydrogenase family protein [Alteribacillus iranensis]|uniref:Aldehyde dehydrogenase (NAD+) n=1 Tax=Alteribacillus iranensis TaxID=930128 RepID=A0A1I2B7H7_9BACI|nr:aldehyde dehydrogenase family protein [Alteribacillus iranensis]SFE52036.1 aldehyde dehydrogenase (NAD+) [Alteribacillus iranensis]
MTQTSNITTYYNLIGGEETASSANETIVVENPAKKSEKLGIFQKSTQEDLEKAVEAAKKALPDWKETPAPARGEYIQKAARYIEERAEEYKELLVREVGKSYKDADAEVVRTIRAMRFLSGEAERMTGETIPSWIPGVRAYTKREPLGVVGVITPWNVPLAIAAWKIATAIATGNTVVFKPSSQTPLISYRLIEAYREVSLPDGVVNFITGSGSVVGNGIASHKDIKAVSFTGSNPVGSHINKLVAERGGRFQAEMGGKNPFVVLEDADLDLATSNVIDGGFGESGQRCTATSRVILVKDIAETFIEQLLEKVKNVKVGNPMEDGTTMGPVVDEGAMKSILEYIEIGKKEGAELLAGGHQLEDGEHSDGYFIAPTVFRNVTPDMTIAQEEIFGPVISIMIAEDYDQALEWANDIDYGLSSTIYTNDMERATHFMDHVEAGLTHVNMMTMWSEPHLPFGGIKDTGIGGYREQGSTGINFFTEWKTAYVKPHNK